MRTLGAVIMIAATVGLFAVAFAARYPLYDRRPLREQFGPRGWLLRASPYRKFIDERPARGVLLGLILALGVGWVLHHYG